MADDVALLKRYADEHSESAFAELVRRHLDLVYGAALRRVVGDVQLAEEITQTVFTDLARKATALSHHPVLIGWLHRSTYFATLDALRSKSRREKREQPIDPMNDDVVSNSGEEIDWEATRPVIDSLLDQLNERDRGALLLRYFEGCSFAEIGRKLALSEDAARMRVDRALEKIRALLARRGVRSTSAALGVALVNHAGVAAPAGFAATVTSAAVTGAAASSAGLGITGFFFAMTKIKTAVAVAITTAAVTTAVLDVRANRALRAELQAARADGAEVQALEKERRRAKAELDNIGGQTADTVELERLRLRLAALKARPPGVTDANMRPATVWRNAGRATPEATWETFCHALFTGDLDGVANLLVFRDATPKDREAFMARFSDAVRARYGTPERICAAAFFGAGDGANRASDDAFQILSVDEIGFDRVRIRAWLRQNGRESEGRDSYSRTPDGWAIALRSVNDKSVLDIVGARIDPVTGNVLPWKKQ